MMLVDADHCFISQRQCPRMALLQTALEGADLLVYDKHRLADQIRLPLNPDMGRATIKVQLFEDSCQAVLVAEEADRWFSRKLERPCHLVYMPDSFQRKVDPEYARRSTDIAAFSDAFPLLLIGQASLDDLNSRLAAALPMDRFRPNIVFTGGRAFEEDSFAAFEINGIGMSSVKPCARCVITTIDQQTGHKAKEPLLTLSKYRRLGHKILFGQNLLYDKQGVIAVGQPLKVLKRQPFLF
ncbi:MOSC domain-containing protein [Niabella terrae]